MVKSMNLAAKVPHFHYVDEMNCDALIELKSSFQNENSDPTIRHTFLPMLIKSLSVALSKYPLLNSCFNEELLQVTLKGMLQSVLFISGILLSLWILRITELDIANCKIIWCL